MPNPSTGASERARSDWREAMASVFKSLRNGDLAEWELSLLVLRVEQAISETEAAARAVDIDALWAATAHGDEDHRQWLKDAYTAFFAGKPVPEPRGSGRKEAEIVRLKAELTTARAAAFEEAARVVAALESPFDHHKHTPQDCAYHSALEAAEHVIRALSSPSTMCRSGGSIDTPTDQGALSPPAQPDPAAAEREAVVAWLRSFDGLHERLIAAGAYIRGSTAHGEDRDRAGYYGEAADAIARGEHRRREGEG